MKAVKTLSGFWFNKPGYLSHILHILPLIIVFLHSVFILFATLREPPAWTLDLGHPQDERFLDNVFLPETAGDTSFRWSSPGTLLHIHGASSARQILSIRGHGLTAAQPDNRVMEIRRGVGNDEELLTSFAIPEVNIWRIHRVLLPEGALVDKMGEPVPLRLFIASYFHEHRALGIAMDQIRLIPLTVEGALWVPLLRVFLYNWFLVGLAGLLWYADKRWLAGGTTHQRARRVGIPIAIISFSLILLAWKDQHLLAWLTPAPIGMLILGVIGLTARFWIRWLWDEPRSPGTQQTTGAESPIRAQRSVFTGLFLVALATLMYENLLTRIFSVTMWYHFAFIAISVAMFGMTFGAMLVYLFPRYFTSERAPRHMSIYALLFGITIIFSFLTHLSIPFTTEQQYIDTVVGFYSMAFTYLVIAVPFVFSGICITLALTRFPRQVSKLYAADLAGAATGCILVIITLRYTSGPTAVLVVALLACLGAAFFAIQPRMKTLAWLSVVCGGILALLVVLNTTLVSQQDSPFRLLWVRGEKEPKPLYEKWNSFSRITIRGNPEQYVSPLGWGMSTIYPENKLFRQLWLTIDAGAATAITAFHGNPKDIEHLKYDVTNLAHYIRPDARVFVVGSGGGRDILSSLLFNQASVTGVDINENTIHAINNEFGNFTGYLDTYPSVRFVHDEARSYLARQEEPFDIIQISLIDTWAATTAGAFVLSENSLYTIEAWDLFLKQLTPDGVLTVSRWYFGQRPGEMYRITSLAAAALQRHGITNPRDHMIIVKNNELGRISEGVGTLLLSKEPFSKADRDTIESIAERMRFGIVLSPDVVYDETFEQLASGQDFHRFVSSFPINIAPPTDNSPFFFQMLRLNDIFDDTLLDQGMMSFNMHAVRILGYLIIIVLVLAFLFILLPLLLTLRTKKTDFRGSLPLFAFFFCIGFGFMLVEISQMQRLIIFLGHPTYSLSVVLFTVLLASGLGSYLTESVGDERLGRAGFVRLALLLASLMGFGILTPAIIPWFESAGAIVRILVSIAILFPIGVFMGMAFPLGMKHVMQKTPDLAPWFWGVNGATSVCASVFAVAIALSTSISTSFWIGFLFYVGAMVSFFLAARPKSQQPNHEAFHATTRAEH